MRIADEGPDDARTARELEALDHSLPLPDVNAIVARGRERVRANRQRRFAMAAAATIVFTAASAAALLPGSPVRALVRNAVSSSSSAPDAAVTVSEVAPTDPLPTGVAFAVHETVEVRFRAAQATGEVRVVLSDTGGVRVTHAAGAASYLLTSRGVTIDNAGSSASFDVVLPKSVSKAEIVVAGRPVFTLEKGAVRGARRSEGGVYVVPLAGGNSR